MKTQGQLYFFLLFFAVLAIVATLNLVRSRIGRAFIAIRDQDIAAEIIGINIFRYKLLAFAISSFYAGVCGVLYTYYLGIANYEQFQIGVSIDYLAMIIIGGLGSVLGSILGAVFVTMLPIVIRLVDGAAGGPVLQRRRAVERGRQHAAGAVRRPDHLLSGGRARRAQSAVAQHPQLFPGLAIFLLSGVATKQKQRRKRHDEMHESWLRLAAAAGAMALGGGAAFAQEKELVFGLQCDRTGADADRRRRSCAPAITTTSPC